MKVWTITTSICNDGNLESAIVKVATTEDEARTIFKQAIKNEFENINMNDPEDYVVDFEEDDDEMNTSNYWEGYLEDSPSDYDVIIEMSNHEI